MPTFMDWLHEVKAALKWDRLQNVTALHPNPPSYYAEMIGSVDFAERLYEAYIDQTQIEELADVEGVGE